MPGDPSGSSFGRASDEQAARLLLDESMRSILGVFLGEGRSVAEAAQELGRDLDEVLYRVRRLRDAGVLEVVGERRRAGRPVKVYRSRFETWFVPFETLPYADVEEALLALHRQAAERFARASARHLQRTPWAGFMVRKGDDGRVWMHGAGDPGASDSLAAGAPVPVAGLPRLGPAAGATDATVELRLSVEDAHALNEELLALLERYMSRSRPEEGAPNRFLSVASVPLDPD